MPLPRGGRMKVVENANGGEKVTAFSVQIDVRNDCFFVENDVYPLKTLRRPVLFRMTVRK